MTVDSLEARVGQETDRENLDNYVALNGLYKLLSGDAEARGLLDQIHLPTYTAPDGCGIIVTPDYSKSREVPLDIEIPDEDGGWRKVSSDSEEYDCLVGRYREFELYFVGKSIYPDIFGERETYIWSEDGHSRVKLTNEVNIQHLLLEPDV